ncbi:hypothetical protein [Jeotgalibacillus proteolyticus]|uniref:Uncharacterized protein n=1 Tax=Jeotgalibacillus proteolyticus TaxID=2082395 RepID=A0A2S5GG05_9BACL|nr:hypothetical protein [Jeotgalibacillus proteolyticus]PPA71854.1 hypothetical protein C4B60_00295 [Jeotgalibacillus proteolyticus]
MRFQPAMIAVNIIFAALTGFWTVQNIIRGETAMAALLGFICVINVFIAIRRYQIAKLHDERQQSLK